MDWSRDDGFVGGTEALPFGVLVFVVGALMVANTWRIVDADLTIDIAAREATRLIVESDTYDAQRVEATITRVATDLGLDADGLTMNVDGANPGSPLTRCARVVVEVSYRVPAIAIPGRATLPVTVSGRHSEVVDPYRSSAELLEGTCPP